MTREEAIHNIEEAISLNSEYIFIHEIFNDFESRTCENCKHYEPEYENEDYGICTDNKYTKNIFTDKDFGCNQWESK